VYRNEREKKKRVITKERREKGLSSAYERIWNLVPSKFGSRSFFYGPPYQPWFKSMSCMVNTKSRFILTIHNINY
jgi:hypothetical protein